MTAPAVELTDSISSTNDVIMKRGGDIAVWPRYRLEDLLIEITSKHRRKRLEMLYALELVTLHDPFHPVFNYPVKKIKFSKNI